MEKRGNNLEEQVVSFTEKFVQALQKKEILIISHFDTDGISSASIAIKALKKEKIKFSVKILKSLEKEFIKTLPKNKLILFLDLASGSLKELRELNTPDIFIIDHHELPDKKIGKINMINPELDQKQKISSSGLTYLFAKQLNASNKEFAKFAVLGMVGDLLEKEIDKLNHDILNDGEIKRKKGILIYPSTRPINRTLEYSSNPYIPGVTGDVKGVLELLRECGLTPKNGKYKSILELTPEEMSKIVTAIMLRTSKNEELIGDIFLIKQFNKLEDARELSAKINACSRMDEPSTALMFCMEVPKARKKAESIHVKYRQNILSGLNYIKENAKIKGKQFVIINAKDQIKDTIIGTLASILSNSPAYEQGTVITTMAYREDKIKISARNVGGKGRNVRQILSRVIQEIGGGEVGGHEHAAGCLISKEQEEIFTKCLKRNFEVETIKV